LLNITLVATSASIWKLEELCGQLSSSGSASRDSAADAADTAALAELFVGMISRML
jgi:hypothetical protein